MIDERELNHRLCNGFISHDGMVDGRFTDVFKDAGITWADISNDQSPYGKMMELVIDIIESVPKTDGLKHGHWIPVESEEDIEYKGLYHCFTCSECGDGFEYLDECYDSETMMSVVRYCPNCGAKMDEVSI